MAPGAVADVRFEQARIRDLGCERGSLLPALRGDRPGNRHAGGRRELVLPVFVDDRSSGLEWRDQEVVVAHQLLGVLADEQHRLVEGDEHVCSQMSAPSMIGGRSTVSSYLLGVPIQPRSFTSRVGMPCRWRLRT